MTSTIFSAYCACLICCGPNADGLAANNKPPVSNFTIAGPRALPLGTRVKVYIPGWGTNIMVLNDRMSKKWDGKRWDIYLGDHRAAKQFGLKSGYVQILSTPSITK